MAETPVVSGEIVIVGPTHPYTGGIAQHTTRLAQTLENSGHSVVVESWSSQYPSSLYKGSGRVNRDEPEIGVASRVRESLAWYSPVSWIRAGARARRASALVLTIPTPLHFVPYFFLLAAAGRKPKRIGIIHNVIPHERFTGDEILMRWLIGLLNRVIVHNTEAAKQVGGLSKRDIEVVVESLPSPWSSNVYPPKAKRNGSQFNLVFFGTIRKYKGLDLLLSAMATVPRTHLTVAGEFWEEESLYRQQIQDLNLKDRVTIKSGYVKARDFPELFSNADVLVLPYRSATGSIVRELGFDFGLPVIASDVGSLAEGIKHGKNGLIVRADDEEDLASAIRKISQPKTLEKLSRGARSLMADRGALWAKYCAAVVA